MRYIARVWFGPSYPYFHYSQLSLSLPIAFSLADSAPETQQRTLVVTLSYQKENYYYVSDLYSSFTFLSFFFLVYEMEEMKEVR